jgi:two-component system, LytTR family, sensor kinase
MMLRPRSSAAAGPGGMTAGQEPNWPLIGAVGWTVVTIAYALSWGLRRLSFGLPFYDSWQQLANIAILFSAGAALSPLLLVLFRRVRAAPRDGTTTVLLYVVIGIAYWIAWSLVLLGLQALGVLSVGSSMSSADRMVRNLVFGAYINLSLYAVMVMLFEAMRYLRESRRKGVEAARMEAELAQAQTTALRARMNPDFLFQSFAVTSELMDRDVRAARRVLSDLSELLRVSLGRDEHQLIELRDEMQLLQRYLEIQEARCGERLRFELACDPAVSSWRVPPLLLQPLAEAAVHAGADARERSLRIRVVAERAGADLRLVMSTERDAEAGAPALAIDASRIADTRALLEVVYDGDASISLTAHAQGFQAELTIPDASAAFADTDQP